MKNFTNRSSLDLTPCYEDFFEAANGFKPYPYQYQFHQRDRHYAIHTLIAPTGLGKTECFAVDWLWGICHDRSNTPSRLVISLPMRTLTHQTFDRVSKILQELKQKLNLDTQVSCHKLVGGTGEVMDRSWCNYIDRPAIIIGTQDQILSRQLFKGYATSRWEWPIHAALLNNDVRIVVDETQLQGVGYQTSILLQKFAADSGHFGRRELVLCSATLDPTLLNEHQLPYQSIALSNDDRAVGSAAAQKINFPKQLHQSNIPNQNYVELIARKIIEEHIPDTLSLCIVNLVDDAIQLMARLVDSGVPIKLLHSRFRGHERDLLSEDLANFRGVVISTQVIEAGIDLDARKLFTMPCPWASFVQRCGRAGRNGTYDECDVYLLDVQGLEPLPYDRLDIKEFWKCFEQLPDVKIVTLLGITPPTQPISGDNLTSGLLKGLFDSHPIKNNSGEDVSGYIRGKTDETLSIMWREFEGEPAQDWRYRQEELCRIKVKQFHKFYSGSVWVWHDDEESWVLTDKPGKDRIVLLPRSAGGYDDKLGFTGKSSDIPPILPLQAIGKSKRELYGKTDFVTLKQHSIDARYELEKIAKNLQHLDLGDFWDLVIDCAQWHDLGKAHDQFRNAINDRTEIWAKAPSMGRYERRGFRHELASAIGALINGKCFLFAYIVVAHHGKVRVRLDNFHWLKDERGLRGLIEGDTVPTCFLGENTSDKIEGFTIELPDIGEWKCAVNDEIDKLGVFKLSYLETLVRIADRRASSRRAKTSHVWEDIERAEISPYPSRASD
jgi:CRISPR-associated endonuclease/helicase Cas3